ncbi:MAG TPA: carboxylesterase family protein [Allosphingosinicella sp.]|nr:carboxylesterase family protein [Allosphingosinicella sp.]
MQGPIVETQYGRVRGRSADGISRFFNIPYAAPPVDLNRFRAPQPHERWRGVREADEIGPTAPQFVRDFPGLDFKPLIGNGWRRGGDYLNLNVWAPEVRGPSPLRPVMVWIHGGGFVVGSNYSPVQDGSAFARSGIVCIAINYRLGVEGFLPVPLAPNNLGLRDILCALHWVRDNVGAFGGDPRNITLFGGSAGGTAVADLMASPRATGLFRRAIIQSGHGNMVRSGPVAQRLVDKVAKWLGVTPDLRGFRSAGLEDCARAVENVSLPSSRIDLRDHEGREPVFGTSRFVPVVGNDVLPMNPLEAVRMGAGAEIDLLIGTNAEEMNLYLVPTAMREKLGSLLAWYVLSRSQPSARAVLKAYGRGHKKPGEALADAMNDLVFRWPARRFAEAHRGRTHFYEFDWRSPAFGGQLGACQGLELPFVFDTLASVTGPDGLVGTDPPQALADRVHRLWVDFATDGSLPWPEYDRESRLVYQLERGEAVHEPVMPAAPFSP